MVSVPNSIFARDMENDVDERPSNLGKTQTDREYRSVPQILFQLRNYVSLGFSTRCTRDRGVVEVMRHNIGALVYYAIMRGRGAG